MASVIKPVTALLLSAGIVLAGNGLEGVLLPLRGSLQGFSELQIGLIGAGYHAGLMIGCLICPRIIGRVGHIRAFTVFTAVATMCPLIEAMWPTPEIWWIFRGLTGVCLAGILNAVESWMTSVASNENRGQVMSTYTVVNFGSVTIGQQFINLSDPMGFQLFSLGAILFSLAAVPLALTLTPHPPAPRQPKLRIRQLYRVSPAAVAGAFGAGIANGAFWSMAPVYARESGVPIDLIPAFVSLTVVGGALAQWPMGRLSDHFDRRTVLAGLCLSAALMGLALLSLGQGAVGWKLAIAVLFGFSMMPIYWISFAHANDLAERDEAVDVSSSLLLLFASGAIFGPIFSALLMRNIGPSALFMHTATVHVVIAAVVIFRITRRAPLPPQQRIASNALRTSNTPAGFENRTGDAAEKTTQPAGQ
jgi:MFS family permease